MAPEKAITDSTSNNLIAYASECQQHVGSNSRSISSPQHQRLKRPSRCLPLDLNSAKFYQNSMLLSCSKNEDDFGPSFTKRQCCSPTITQSSSCAPFISAHELAALLQQTEHPQPPLCISSSISGHLPAIPCIIPRCHSNHVVFPLDFRTCATFHENHVCRAFHCPDGQHNGTSKLLLHPAPSFSNLLLSQSLLDGIYSSLHSEYPILFSKMPFTGKLTKMKPAFQLHIVLIFEDTLSSNKPPLSSPVCSSSTHSDWVPLSDFLSSICDSYSISVLSDGFRNFSVVYPELCEGFRPETAALLLEEKDVLKFPSDSSSSCNSSPVSREENHLSLSMPLCGSASLASPFEGPLISSEDVHLDWFNHKASRILPFLFLGSEFDSRDVKFLRSQDVCYVLNVSSTLPFIDEPGVYCHRIPLMDSNTQELKLYWKEAYDFIEEARHSGHGVLVHCQAGVSRSAAIVIAYLMLRNHWKLNEAYDFVRLRRKCIAPNFNFLGQLMQLEDSQFMNVILEGATEATREEATQHAVATSSICVSGTDVATCHTAPTVISTGARGLPAEGKLPPLGCSSEEARVSGIVTANRNSNRVVPLERDHLS